MNMLKINISILSALLFSVSYGRTGIENTSIDVLLIGDATVRYSRTNEAKGSEAGILWVSLEHPFSKNLSSECKLRLSRSATTPLVEKAVFGFNRPSFDIGAGLMYHRFGLTELYQPHSLKNRFSQNPILWESRGLGINGTVHNKFLFVSLLSEMNNRETGSAYLQGGFSYKDYSGFLISGIQINDPDYQGIAIKNGFEGYVRKHHIEIHTVIVHHHYQGYGQSGTPAPVPRYNFHLLGETRFLPHPRVTVALLGSYQRYKKSSLHVEYIGGGDISFTVLYWLAVGTGYEMIRRDACRTHTPELFGKVIFPDNNGSIRLGASRIDVLGTTSYFQITGSIWFAY
jgi:hypothetical protein